MAVTTTFSDASFDPTDFFVRSQGIALSMGEHELVRHDEEVTLPGGKGIIFHVMDSEEDPIASIAYVRFESGQNVTVDLQTTGPRTLADENLLFEVTQSLRAHAGAPVHQPTSTDSVDL